MEGFSETPLKVGFLLDEGGASDEVRQLITWAASQPLIDPHILELASSDLSPSGIGVLPKILRALSERPPTRVRQVVFGLVLRVKESVPPEGSENEPTAEQGRKPYWGLPVLRVETRRRPVNRVALSEASLSQVCDLELDCMVRLNSAILEGGVLTAAKHGVLSFHHGDNRAYRGGPAGFWEIFNREVTTGFVLQRLNEELDGGEVLLRRNYRTLPSLTENRKNLSERSYPLLKERLLELARRGNLLSTELSMPFGGGITKTPTVFQSAKYLLRPRSSRSIWVAISGHVKRRFRVSEGDWATYLVKSYWRTVSLRKGVQIPAATGHWLADPCLARWEGDVALFVEDFDTRRGRGSISVISGSDFESPVPPTPVITEPFHVSFPFVFEHNEQLWMTVESAEARQVRLYHCTDFPLKWVFFGTLLNNVTATDPIVFERNGTWFLLCTVDPLDAGDADSELHLFSSDSPLPGSWRPCPANPVKCDPRSARNGGLLKDRGTLFRVAQEPKFGEYGSSLGIYEIHEIGPDGYREERVGGLRASWRRGLRGPHTLSSVDGWAAFDLFS